MISKATSVSYKALFKLRILPLFAALLAYSFFAVAVAAPARIPLVVVNKARTDTVVRQVPLSGTVTPLKHSRLSAQVSGLVKKANIEVGDTIEAGDVLIQLDKEIEELTLKAARAATRQARAKLADAKRRYESAKRLKRQSSISIEEIDNREAQVNIEEASLQKIQAEEYKQKAIVERFSVKAPFAGVVSEKMTDVGEWIAPGDPILSLVAIDKLRIDFQVPQEFYIAINAQSRINVSLDALPGEVYAGKIVATVPVSDPSARTFLMRVILANADIGMTPGMSVNGSLQLDTGKRGVVVSRDAILRYPDGRITVWIVTQDDGVPKVSERPVKIGHSFDGQVSLSHGLQAGVLVVTQGNESLQNGQTVRIQNNSDIGGKDK